MDSLIPCALYSYWLYVLVVLLDGVVIYALLLAREYKHILTRLAVPLCLLQIHTICYGTCSMYFQYTLLHAPPRIQILVTIHTYARAIKFATCIQSYQCVGDNILCARLGATYLVHTYTVIDTNPLALLVAGTMLCCATLCCDTYLWCVQVLLARCMS